MESYSNCAHCGHDLKGRTDKRFCNDTCRNTYNRIQRQKRHVPLPEQAKDIFQAIKQNYQLIAHKKGLEWNEELMGELDDMVMKGFDPKYFTNIHIADNGQQWCCIFGWCFYVSSGKVMIKDFPETIFG